MSDIEAEVSTLPSSNADSADWRDPDRPKFVVSGETMAKIIRAQDPAPGFVEDSIIEVAAVDNARRLEQMRRVRRAAVNRLIDFVRIEQLALNGPNDRTSVEELTHDAIMKALDLYFEGRPKASPDSMSMAIDTLERIHAVKGGK